MPWNAWLAEYKLSTRRPNRKFKVPRNVLAERLKMFWIAAAKVRKFVMLKFGGDPVFLNVCHKAPLRGDGG